MYLHTAEWIEREGGEILNPLHTLEMQIVSKENNVFF